ncbi:hypothetical protein STSP_20330 [Streptomyces jeddahensis]|uniref:Uncharacterized protein n=1 Tax=Streptomyces jeddahensis TaxID=1716141 RepID=A0A177HU82_9ACTN|nr:hypothetical protein STSP_20330 [Streptomyces jeddahensis]
MTRRPGQPSAWADVPWVALIDRLEASSLCMPDMEFGIDVG